MRNAEWPDEGRSPCRASIDIPHSAFRNPHLIFMHRVLIISHTYLPPSNRGKLRALALPWLAGWRRNRTLRRLRGAIAGSEGAAALVRRLVPGLRVGVIPQLGVHVPTEPEHAYHDGLAIGCVGRLVPEKGIDTLLQALAENRAHRWHLTVVGDGPDRERLERLASDLRLAARVRWSGALPPEEVPKLWPELDVLVLPARGLPTWAEPAAHVVAEAMAHEVTVVGTSGGATPEVIGDAGIVVPGDDPLALSAALRRLAAADQRRPLAQAGRARAMRLFSDDAVAERTLEFWREIVSNCEARRYDAT